MRGSKHSDEIREKALALLMSGESVGKTAKALNLSYTTVKTWEKKIKARQVNADGGEKKTKNEKSEIENDNFKSDEVQYSDEPPKEINLDEVRNEKKKSFIDKSWRIIEDAQKVLERRVSRAVHKEDVIDEIISIVEERSGQMKDEEKQRILRRIEGLRLDDVRAITSIIATLYDKQALASGDPTLNVSGGVKFEDL